MLQVPVSMVKENARRNAVLDNVGYNPRTGVGSPIKRSKLFYDSNRFVMVPDAMLADERLTQFLEYGSAMGLAAMIVNDGDPTDIADEIWSNIMEIRLDHDFEFWGVECARVQDKRSKKPVPFLMRSAQLKLFGRLYKMLSEGTPIRVVLLKARQWGGSTLIQLFMYWIQLRVKTSWHSAIVGDVESQARNIRAMISRVNKHYPSRYGKIKLVPFEGSPKDRMIEHRDCVISIGSAQKPDGLRSGDLGMCHLSEIGVWKVTASKSPEDLAQSVRAAILDEPGTLIALESTAKGTGNFFHNEWLAAVKGESAYDAVFVAWFEIDLYRRKIPEGKLDSFVRGWTEYEKRLWESGATFEGIYWYRSFKKREGYSDWRMNNEFPSWPEEAFNATSMRAFRLEDIQRAAKNVCKPLFVGDIKGLAQSGKESLTGLEFVSNSRGSLLVWYKPDKINMHHRYLVTVDVGGRSEGADYSVIRVFDRAMKLEGGVMEAVAVWRGHIDHDLLAWKAAQIAAWYNNALLAIEVNSLEKDAQSGGSHAITVLDTIMDYYPNMYMRKAIDNITHKETFVPGWFTDRKTKPAIVGALNAALRDNLYIEHYQEAVDEMMVFEEKADGTFGNADGKGLHDDIVVPTGIAVYLDKELPMPFYVNTTPRQTHKVVSVGVIN